MLGHNRLIQQIDDMILVQARFNCAKSNTLQPSNMTIKNRKILITGASRGIGRAIAETLIQEGATVIGIARDFSTWNELPKKLFPLQLDLTQLHMLPEQIKNLTQQHLDIDGIIFNAGEGRFGSLEEFSPKQICHLIDLNLTSQILLARELLPNMKRQKQGDLIFIGSEAALNGSRKGSVYCATKFALRGFAQSLREECSNSGIRSTIINPGMVKTGFFDTLSFEPGNAEENYILPQDAADAVLAILSARPGTCFDEINISPLKKVIKFK